MDTAIISRSRKSEYAVFLAGLLLILLVLSRYAVNGEPVDVRTDASAMTITLPLSDSMEICQPLTITEDMNWRQGYYALCFAECDKDNGGQIICTLEQDGLQDTCVIDLSEINAGEWTKLEGLDFRKLKSGAAMLRLDTEGVAEGELAVAAGSDYYGFGILDLNGVKQELTLAQAYHYHMTGMEYRVRLLCYGIVLLCAGLLFLTVQSERIGSGRKCLTAFGIMTVMFMAVIYLLDSSVYLEPAYAEAVTNFLHYAREEKFTANLLITDAGYLPLLPRLITLLYVKVLRLPSAYALYFMQITACLLCSMVWSFYVLPPFEGFMRLHNRILWCILVMLSCFYEETIFFTNHTYWGIYLLLLLLIVDLERFPGWIYVGLTGISVLICLSKGTYVVLLPLMILYLFFFGRSISRKDKVLACVIGGASLLQLVYSFGGQGDGGGWVSTASTGQISYWCRLVGRTFTEFGAYLLTPLGAYIQNMSGFILISGVAVFVFLVVDFTGGVLIPEIRKETIDRRRTAFYVIVMFQLIVSAFYLVTVKKVPDSWRNIGKFSFSRMGYKYEIFSNAGFYMLLLTGGALLRGRGMSAESWRRPFMPVHETGQRNWHFRVIRYCGQYGVLALLCVFCLTNPVMKLGGWAEAETSDGRVYARDINAGWRNHIDKLSDSAFFIPVRGDNWAYSQNATVFQTGTELYFEEASCINREDILPAGYQSAYKISDEEEIRNLIDVMIEYPVRIGGTKYRVRLLDADQNVLAEAEQTGSGRYKKCMFHFEEPVSGVKTIQFTDEAGNPVYFKDYIAWVCAW